MTDAETRAEWNRLLAADESDLTVDDLLRLPAGAVSLLRLLAESQQALREIYKKTERIIGPPSDGPYDFDSDCKTCVAVEELAKTAIKEE